MVGDYKRFVWRLRPEWKEEEKTDDRLQKTDERRRKAEDLVDFLNLVQHPDFKRVKEFISARAPDEELQKRLERERIERSSLVSRIMTDTSKMDLEEARALAAVIGYLRAKKMR